MLHQTFDADPAALLPRRPLFDLPVVDARPAPVINALMAPGRRRIAFLNAHCVNVAARDPIYRAALATADAVLPDGAGLEIAARLSGGPLAANLNGTDFLPGLLAEAARRGRSVFLLGARPGVAEAAASRLWRAIPGLRIAGTRHGYGDDEDDVAAINASGADILLVAKGVPAQDVWTMRHAARLRPALVIGVGAFLDFAAGAVPRAPAPLRRARLEWVWRLGCEPRRLAGRYLWGNVAFLGRLAARMATPEAKQRLFDLAVAGSALVLLAPLLAFVALAVRLDSRGPAFFRQTRIGRDGRPFTMLKFRSMHVDAEARLAQVRHLSDRDGPCFKSRHDPRITRVGRFIRRASIDELPQIWNILRGDMSAVGPRPALPSEVAAFPPRARGRLAVRPGLTGVWQVSGRAEIGTERMIDMDLAYVAERTLGLDLAICLRTVGAVIGGRGAC